MAAPAPPAQTQNAQQPIGKMNPPAPLSPGAQSRERDRVTLLLDINRVLLQEVLKLQEQGKTGPLPQPGQNPDEGGSKEGEPRASQEYIQLVQTQSAQSTYGRKVNLSNTVFPEPCAGCRQTWPI